MKNNPLISIITVVYNGEKFLEQTVQSVLNQTYENIEYIIIDGGSTDGTLDIIKKYENQIDYWVSEKDNGISNAFNKGYFASNGDWIVMLNSGDWYTNENIVKMIMEENNLEKYSFIYGDFIIIDPFSQLPIKNGNVILDYNKLKYGLVLPHPCLFTRRDYFLKYGLFNESFKIAMDYEWMLRGIQEVEVKRIDKVVTIITDGGVSTQNQRLTIKEILLALQINHFCNIFCLAYIKCYFYSRYFLKKTLIFLGLYKG